MEQSTATPIYNYPLPANQVPHPNVSRDRETRNYLLPPLDNSRKPREQYSPDFELVNVPASNDGLSKFKLRQTVYAIARQPELLANLQFRGTEESIATAIDNLVTDVSRSAYSGAAREWGGAVRAWVLALGYDFADPSEVPAPLVDTIRAYWFMCKAYGLTLNKRLSNRYVYNATTHTVSNTGLVFDIAGGGTLVATLRTGTKLDHVKITDAVRMGNVVSGNKILTPGSQSWGDMPEEFADAHIGIIHSPRTSVQVNLVSLDRLVVDELHTNAMTTLSYIKDAEDTLDTASLDVQDMRALVRTTKDKQRLSQLYKAHSDAWTDELTELGRAQMN